MKTTINSITTACRALALAAFTGVLGFACAVPASAQPLASYANRSADEQIAGTISAINGPYNISVRDARGFIDSVTLHQGTIINPTGFTLAPGQSVTILGQAQGSTFAANEIDTPYQTVFAAPLYPVYPYYGPAYGYPGYGYGFGLRAGRGFGFGFRG